MHLKKCYVCRTPALFFTLTEPAWSVLGGLSYFYRESTGRINIYGGMRNGSQTCSVCLKNILFNKEWYIIINSTTRVRSRIDYKKWCQKWDCKWCLGKCTNDMCYTCARDCMSLSSFLSKSCKNSSSDNFHLKSILIWTRNVSRERFEKINYCSDFVNKYKTFASLYREQKKQSRKQKCIFIKKWVLNIL